MNSLRGQKIILWIPLANAFLIFIYIYNSLRLNWKGGRFILGIIFAFFAGLFPTLGYRMISTISLGLFTDKLINIIYIYIACICIGVVLIKYQQYLGLE